MASGPLVSGGGGRSNGPSHGKHRRMENKVRPWKSFNKGRGFISAVTQEPEPEPLPPRSSSLQSIIPAEEAFSYGNHHRKGQGRKQQQQRYLAMSEDSTSLLAPGPTAARDSLSSSNGFFPHLLDNRVTISVASCSKQEIRDLRQRLTRELDQVRRLLRRLESCKSNGYSTSLLPNNDAADSGFLASAPPKQAVSEASPIMTCEPLPPRPLSVSVFPNGVALVEKEKRTPKANKYYRNSEFLLGKERLPPPDGGKKPKSNGRDHSGPPVDQHLSQAFKNCAALLTKLMKHKHAYDFNRPVDVKTLGLHDYFTIIKHPMDLGTVKSRLSKNWYKSPHEFAEDVRLTFRNAMTYNPKGHAVHIMAEQLSEMFEERWSVIELEYDPRPRFDYLDREVTPPGSLTPHVKKSPLLPEITWTLDRSESTTRPIDSKPVPVSYTLTGRVGVPKKPKAKDPNKRDMTNEEKQRLSTNLSSLPSEKLDNVVQIIKKRNAELSQHDDEIELDIDSFDVETLWELDRFVTNYKKSLSKIKRKAELASQAKVEAANNGDQEMNAIPSTVEAPKENEKRVATSPVEGDKPTENASRSSSSSSSSSDSGSSSSDSESESSSGSEAGHSPRS